MITYTYQSNFTSMDGVELGPLKPPGLGYACGCTWAPAEGPAPGRWGPCRPEAVSALPSLHRQSTHPGLPGGEEDFRLTLPTLGPHTEPGLQWVWQNVSRPDARMSVWVLSAFADPKLTGLSFCGLSIFTAEHPHSGQVFLLRISTWCSLLSWHYIPVQPQDGLYTWDL